MPLANFRIGVRELVSFCCRQGDLGFHEAQIPRAEQGQYAQRMVQQSKPAGYKKEVFVEKQLERETFSLTISGRIDGLWIEDEDLFLEEIKSTYYEKSTLPENLYRLHQAQAIVYAAMLHQKEAFSAIRLRVTYYQLREEYSFFREEVWSSDQVLQYFANVIVQFCEWLKLHFARLEQRNLWCSQLAFPFPEYRPGQRILAVNAYRHLRDKKNALIQAPTGSGKTISTLFPALKHFTEQPAQRIFYLTAKTSGQRSVAQAMDTMKADKNILGLFLTAKAQLCPCLSDATAFDIPAACSNCIGYFDRRQPALVEALLSPRLDRIRILEIAAKHQICPHQLALDIAPWVDIITGDFNYVFDPFAGQGLAETRDTSTLLLVDEAHNLPERARAMFSCALEEFQIKQVLRMELPPPLRRVLKRLARFCQAPMDAQRDQDNVAVLSLPPPRFAETLLETNEALRLWLDNVAEQKDETPWQLWLSLLAFQRALDHWGDHYQLVYTDNGEFATLQALCLDPGYFLHPHWESSAGSLIFSGTLTPAAYFAQILGLERLEAERKGDTTSIGHALQHTEVKAAIVPLPMQYAARQHSLPRALPFIVTAMQQYAGRFLIAAASFEVLNGLYHALFHELPHYKWHCQKPDMLETDRQQFLESFVSGHLSVALVISGGIFAEGIDLAETPLSGVIQVGLPMPAPSTEKRLIQAYFDKQVGHGFEYTYTYPAIARTLQTCGRLLRKDGDRGCLLLIDARFQRSPYREYLPAHWHRKITPTVTLLESFLKQDVN